MIKQEDQNNRKAPAHKTITSWLITQLEQLPHTRHSFFKLATVCYSITFVFLLISLLGNHISKIQIVGAIVIPLLFLTVVGIGTWLRKRLAQRFSPSLKRNEMLFRLVSTVSTPHPSNNNEFIFRRFRPSTTEPYYFPPSDNDRLLVEVAKLKGTSFLGAAREDTLDNKLRRNHAHQRKNPFCLMLVSDKNKLNNSLSFIGFTHLIPVNEATYNQYLTGEIGDNDLNSDRVCGPDEAAFGVIIFSLGLERYRLKQVFKNKPNGKFDRLLSKVGLPPFRANAMYTAEFDLWVGLIYHLRLLLQNQNMVQWPATILAKSFNAKVVHMLEGAGFNKRKEVSADGEALFELKLTLHEASR